MYKFKMKQRVVKQGEDSYFEGLIVARFMKRNGKTLRYVVENDDGVLHIASDKMLKLSTEPKIHDKHQKPIQEAFGPKR